MCGRARCTLQPDQVAKACGIVSASAPTIDADRYHPSFNVSPGCYLPTVRREVINGNGAVIHCMKWGLIPSFTKKSEKPDHFRMFNARSESVCEKASFRRLVPNNRCLVAVEGFYEWRKDGAKKQPYYIHFNDQRPLVFAALYDHWKNSEGEVFNTFTILTTCCSPALRWLHDRMPVILGDKNSMDAWLIGSNSLKVETILKPYEGYDLVWYPVTPEMGRPSFNGPACIREIQLKPVENISNFFSKTSKIKQESSPDTKMQLKPVENISNFFSNTSKIKQESSPDTKQPSNEAEKPLGGIIKTKCPEALKLEPPSTFEASSLIDFDSQEVDDKSKVWSPAGDGTEKCSNKRNYERLASDSVIPEASSKPSVKKKDIPESSVERQQTLLSYFKRS